MSISSLVMALAHSSIFILAMPYDHKDPMPSHFPRVEVDHISYRVRTTAIILKLTISQVTFQGPITEMLLAAYDTVRNYQAQQDLGLVPGGEFVQEGTGAVLRVWNADNHQLTWGVVGVVVTGLLDLISLRPHAPTVVFKIFDGVHQVGMGQLSVTTG